MENNSPGIAPVRGLLNQRVSMEHFDLIRVVPSDALKPFIENYWIIVWDLEGKPDYVQENLPFPNLHLVIDPNGTNGVFGVHTGVFNYRLSGTGRLFGAKFWPGAFRAFCDIAASEFKDTYKMIDDLFGVSSKELEREFLGLNDPTLVGEIVESVLLRNNPVLDEKALKARELVELISVSPDISRLSQLAEVSGMNVRTIQRLFHSHVGVTPKWVIERNRMLAAVDALNSGAEVSLTDLAHRLGYFDSAHFGRAFQALTGTTPSALLTKS